MSFTYLPGSNDIGKVRMLIPDRVSASAIFTDEEITVFLTLETDVRCATAMAMETIASDQVLTLKVMTLLDVSTSGDRVAAALLARAKLLREQAEQALSISSGGFDYAEMVTTDFAGRERLYNQALRNVVP
jgi:hypothetical protein